MAVERVDAVVVGTGWNGPNSAKTYLGFIPDAKLVLIDEEKSIGGVWSTEKNYPSVFAQIKYGLFEYSFCPMRREGITADGYISGETINTYLNEFAPDYHLVERTRLRTRVNKVERIPKTPGGTVVLGGAKSVYDTVFMLLNNGIQMDWIIRANVTGPLAIMPPTILCFVNSMDVISTRVMAILGGTIIEHKRFHAAVLAQDETGRALSRAVWKTVTKIAEMHAGHSKSANAAEWRPLPSGNGIFWANAGLGCVSVPDFWKVFPAGDCTVHRTEITSFDHVDTVTLRDGGRLKTDYVILCTGFDQSYQPFSPELQRELGLAPDPDLAALAKWADLDARAEFVVNELLPDLKHSPVSPSVHEQRHERGSTKNKPLHGPKFATTADLSRPNSAVSGDRAIYFPGSIHSIYTPPVSEAQALWGCAFLLNLIDVPAQEIMEKRSGRMERVDEEEVPRPR
ncbi:FAD-dependent monooxygenase DEP4 [Exophiala dermatitidis]